MSPKFPKHSRGPEGGSGFLMKVFIKMLRYAMDEILRPGSIMPCMIEDLSSSYFEKQM